MRYKLIIYKCEVDALGRVTEEHSPLGDYTLDEAPWVPRKGDFFRFRDPAPPGMPTDHNETAGHVAEVVTVFYGTAMVIEVYIIPRPGRPVGRPKES